MTITETRGSKIMAPAFPAQITFSPTAEHYLDRVADALAEGAVELHQLPPSLHKLYTFAFYDGAYSREPEIATLNHTADRLYLHAFNTPEQIQNIIQQRLDHGAHEYWETFIHQTDKTEAA